MVCSVGQKKVKLRVQTPLGRRHGGGKEKGGKILQPLKKKGGKHAKCPKRSNKDRTGQIQNEGWGKRRSRVPSSLSHLR